ncbi:MAG: DUF4476 domain-containing protein [Ferruginibacter sp.]
MNRFLLVLLILSAGIITKAQQNHFVYLQTDNKQPFYVKMNDKLFSSSSSGYIVISKLQNGNYNFSIGFPKNEWPLQTLAIKVDNNDLGYMLKNFGDKGWGLFNMQTLNVTMASSADATKSNTVVQNKTDGFSNVLADVVNTPALKENRKVDIIAEVKPASPSQKITSLPAPVQEKEINSVTFISTSLDNIGRSTIYIDKTDKSVDTIKIFIPYNITAVPDILEEKKATENRLAERKEKVNDLENEDKKFLNIELSNPNTAKDTVKIKTSVIPEIAVAKGDIKNIGNTELQKTDLPVSKPVSTNSDCKNLANDNDFMKLRKKMAAENNDDNMIAIARKLFKSICFSTEQIKNLSVLFLKDDGRYRFFDAAYPSVYDSQNFSTLQSQLTDEYQINRFKAMIHH